MSKFKVGDKFRCILDSEWRIKPEPEVIELNGKKYREIVE